MTDEAGCEHCGKPVAPNAPSGLCPACLLRTAIEHGAGRTVAPLLPKLRYFGDYELLEEIARGGMGVVYRARQVSLDRIVAVKMMRPGVLATENEIRRFQAEARTAASMQHPNIVAIHEVGEFDGLHYFSMDFVEGPSLAELVRQGPLAPREAARYVQVLAEAVHYAHGKSILHRDLKPSNVLVDAGGRPRITDFGLARLMEGGDGMTVTGTLIGTPAYMPPEQASGQGGPLTAASDCYSLGAILYELLTGSPPFQAPNALATVRLVLEEQPARLRARDSRIGRDLEAICMRCLEKDPQRRYQSAADLAADLDRYLHGGPVQPWRIPLWRRRWAWAAIAAAILLALFWAMARNERRAAVAERAVRVPVEHVITTPAPTPPPPVKSAPKSRPRQIAAIPAKSTNSVDPDHGSGHRQVFTFRYSEPEDSPVAAAEIEFRDTQTLRSCRVFLEPESQRVDLQYNPEGAPGLRRSGRAGALTELENSVCSVDLSGVEFRSRNRGLEVRLPMTFKSSFNGPKEMLSSPIDAKTGARLGSPIGGTWTVM